jgi:hypothetical protein
MSLAWVPTVYEPGSSEDRYRALLKDANTEQKQLALIQLLIDEGARDKLRAKRIDSERRELANLEPWRSISAFADLPAQSAPPLSLAAAGDGVMTPGHPDDADDASFKLASFAVLPGEDEVEPPSALPAPVNAQPVDEVLATSQSVRGDDTPPPIAPSPLGSEPSPNGEITPIIEIIANLLSSPSDILPAKSDSDPNRITPNPVAEEELVSTIEKLVADLQASNISIVSTTRATSLADEFSGRRSDVSTR